jgi:hypothetical protein
VETTGNANSGESNDDASDAARDGGGGSANALADAVGRWVYALGCLFGVGPLVLSLVAPLTDAMGGHGASFLTAGGGTGVSGVLGLGLIGVASAAVGLVGARVFTLGVGAMGAGIVAAWGAWAAAPLDMIVRVTSDGAALPSLAAEGAIAGLVGVALLWVLERVSHGTQVRRGIALHDPLNATRMHRKVERGVGGIVAVERGASSWAVLGASLAVSIAASLVGVWALAASTSKGQVIAAAIGGGIAAGLGAQLMAKSLRGCVSAVVPALGMMVVALASPIAAGIVHDHRLFAAATAGTLLAPARPLGLDWLAGIMCGVPLGMAWGGFKFDARAHPVLDDSGERARATA